MYPALPRAIMWLHMLEVNHVAADVESWRRPVILGRRQVLGVLSMLCRDSTKLPCTVFGNGRQSRMDVRISNLVVAQLYNKSSSLQILIETCIFHPEDAHTTQTGAIRHTCGKYARNILVGIGEFLEHGLEYRIDSILSKPPSNPKARPYLVTDSSSRGFTKILPVARDLERAAEVHELARNLDVAAAVRSRLSGEEQRKIDAANAATRQLLVEEQMLAELRGGREKEKGRKKGKKESKDSDKRVLSDNNAILSEKVSGGGEAIVGKADEKKDKLNDAKKTSKPDELTNGESRALKKLDRKKRKEEQVRHPNQRDMEMRAYAFTCVIVHKHGGCAGVCVCVCVCAWRCVQCACACVVCVVCVHACTCVVCVHACTVVCMCVRARAPAQARACMSA